VQLVPHEFVGTAHGQFPAPSVPVPSRGAYDRAVRGDEIDEASGQPSGQSIPVLSARPTPRGAVAAGPTISG
jgi:hypothetical protein